MKRTGKFLNDYLRDKFKCCCSHSPLRICFGLLNDSKPKDYVVHIV